MTVICFTTVLQKFGQMGEKTGWTYILLPVALASGLSKEKKVFRVKGQIDQVQIQQVALIPMGDGDFILPVNAQLRKQIRKRVGMQVVVQLMPDLSVVELNKDLMTCLAEASQAMTFFNSLPASHQRYFSKWIDQAKTDTTRIKRIAMSLEALENKTGYSAMLRAEKIKKST